MTNETWLVTGASGCIGAWTVLTLVQEGAEVVALDRDTANQRLRLIGGDGVKPAHAVDVDIRDLPAVERVLDEHGVTHMVHLAALQVPFCRADPPRGAEVNVAGTVNLFEAARRHGLATPIAYASSAAVYDAAGVTLTPTSIYGVYKIANEGSARIYWQESQVASIGLRPLIVYGGGRDQGVTSSPTLAMAAAARGEPYNISFGGSTLMQYGPDVARAFIDAARRPAQGAAVYNLGGSGGDHARDRGRHRAGRSRGAGHLRRRHPALRLPAPRAPLRDGCDAPGRGRGRHRRALPPGRPGRPRDQAGVPVKGVLPEVIAWLGEGRPVALARVVEVVGSGVQPAGAALAVNADGQVAGSASGGCVEGALV